MPSPVQTAVYAALAGYSGLSNKVGVRIYPDVAPQSVTRPFCVWQEISMVPIADLSGTAEASSLQNYRVQVTSWAEGSGARGASIAREVDEQVRLAMQNASQFKSVLVDSRALPYEPDTRLHGVQSDFSIWLKTA